MEVNSTTIAYFSAEIGISASLPTYSGGLGILSGNHIKAAADADSLYQILEQEVIPTYYNDKQKWNQMMRSSIQTAVDFTAHRMIIEYQQKFYQKHHKEVISSVK